MKRLLFISGLIACCAASFAEAVPNLPMTCRTAAVAAACPGDSWITAPGAAGKYVAVGGKGVIDWAAALPADLIRVCPSDIVPGAVCPVARVSIAKSLAATTDAPTSWLITYSWDAVAKDENGISLPVGEITGYALSWNYEVGGDVKNVNLGNVLSYTTTVDYKPVCARVAAIGKTAVGNVTGELCISPKPGIIIVPGIPTNFRVVTTP